MADIVKTVPVFIASSLTELEEERLQLWKFFGNINQIYNAKGIQLNWTAPENTSHEYVDDGSQSVFDQQIRDSQFFFLIIGKKLGKITRHEFDVALEQHKKTKFPVICAYFMPSEGGFPSDEAFAFRKYYKRNLKNYPTDCPHVDSIKLEILLTLLRHIDF